MTVEMRLARLDAIVAALEAGQPELAEALALFEEGITCLREAAGELSVAEARVQRLTELADGAFSVEVLDAHDGE